MKYFHISLFKTRDAAGVHRGGVEQFGMYLQRAIPDLRLLSWPDYPHWKEYGEYADYEKAQILSHWLLDERVLDKDSVVLTDGYWGMGLEGRVGRLISVVHGTYYGRFMQHQIHQWGEIVGMDHVEAQREHWKNEHVEPVAVSLDTYGELITMGIGSVPCIRHGVDAEVYKPIVMPGGRCWMHAATSNRKGLHLIPQIEQLSGMQIEPMNEFSGMAENKAARLNAARALIAPTMHEGNSYLLLEALACNIPVLTFKTGLAWEMDHRCGLITDDVAPHSIANAMLTWDNWGHHCEPREWLLNRSSIESFEKKWREFLEITG